MRLGLGFSSEFRVSGLGLKMIKFIKEFGIILGQIGLAFSDCVCARCASLSLSLSRSLLMWGQGRELGAPRPHQSFWVYGLGNDFLQSCMGS